jgi:hypothetical protein
MPLRAAATEIRRDLNVNLCDRYLFTHRQPVSPFDAVLELELQHARKFLYKSCTLGMHRQNYPSSTRTAMLKPLLGHVGQSLGTPVTCT